MDGFSHPVTQIVQALAQLGLHQKSDPIGRAPISVPARPRIQTFGLHKEPLTPQSQAS